MCSFQQYSKKERNLSARNKSVRSNLLWRIVLAAQKSICMVWIYQQSSNGKLTTVTITKLKLTFRVLALRRSDILLLATFSIAFTANGKRLQAVGGVPFAVATKIEFSMALTSFGGKSLPFKSLFIFFKVFWDKAIHPFSTSSPWEHDGFLVFPNK